LFKELLSVIIAILIGYNKSSSMRPSLQNHLKWRTAGNAVFYYHSNQKFSANGFNNRH